MMNLKLPDIEVPIANATVKVVVRELPRLGDYKSYEIVGEFYNERTGQRFIDRHGKYPNIFRRQVSISHTMQASMINHSLSSLAHNPEAMAIERGYEDMRRDVWKFCDSYYQDNVYFDDGTDEIQFELPALKNVLEDLLYE